VFRVAALVAPSDVPDPDPVGVATRAEDDVVADALAFSCVDVPLDGFETGFTISSAPGGRAIGT
ncbi:MAG: hypothetical protein REI11_12630, partial [Patulibacter sp.]|nr:hypothetical protein [Patulibacter sp.]